MDTEQIAETCASDTDGLAVHRLFPVVVIQKQLSLPQILVDEGAEYLLRICESALVSGDRRVTADRVGQTLHQEQNLLSLLGPVFSHVAQVLTDHLHFSERMTRFYVGRCWPVIQLGAGEGNLHFHAGAIYSGIFFLRVPHGAGGLEFVRPFRTAADTLYRTVYSDLSEPSRAFELFPQDLWLFNGEVWHRALPSDQDAVEPRVAIAFDIYTTTELSNKSGGIPHWDNLLPIRPA